MAWCTGKLNNKGINIHYYRTGGAKPPIVFNHGAGEDGKCWFTTASLLQTDFDVIIPDARGHGHSDSGQGDYSKDARMADLRALIDVLKLDKPIIAGHSMGADTCLHFAAEYPELVSGVILEDPPIVMPGEKFREGFQKISVEKAGVAISRGLRTMKRLPFFLAFLVASVYTPKVAHEDFVPWVQAKKLVSDDFIDAIADLKVDLGDPFDAVEKISVPILMFTGDREKMAIVSRQTAEELTSLNNKLRVVHLDGARHDIRRSQFDLFFEVLENFLLEVIPVSSHSIAVLD